MLGSANFAVQLQPPCSGLEGIFLFMFLLSGMILLDWQWFKRFRLLDIYLVAIVFMFFVNALRITVYVIIGHWANAPDAGEFAQSLGDLPLAMFHSLAGGVLYLI